MMNRSRLREEQKNNSACGKWVITENVFLLTTLLCWIIAMPRAYSTTRNDSFSRKEASFWKRNDYNKLSRLCIKNCTYKVLFDHQSFYTLHCCIAFYFPLEVPNIFCSGLWWRSLFRQPICRMAKLDAATVNWCWFLWIHFVGRSANSNEHCSAINSKKHMLVQVWNSFYLFETVRDVHTTYKDEYTTTKAPRHCFPRCQSTATASAECRQIAAL